MTKTFWGGLGDKLSVNVTHGLSTSVSGPFWVTDGDRWPSLLCSKWKGMKLLLSRKNDATGRQSVNRATGFDSYLYLTQFLCLYAKGTRKKRKCSLKLMRQGYKTLGSNERYLGVFKSAHKKCWGEREAQETLTQFSKRGELQSKMTQAWNICHRSNTELIRKQIPRESLAKEATFLGVISPWVCWAKPYPTKFRSHKYLNQPGPKSPDPALEKRG